MIRKLRARARLLLINIIFDMLSFNLSSNHDYGITKIFAVMFNDTFKSKINILPGCKYHPINKDIIILGCSGAIFSASPSKSYDTDF